MSERKFVNINDDMYLKYLIDDYRDQVDGEHKWVAEVSLCKRRFFLFNAKIRSSRERAFRKVKFLKQ